MNIIEAHNINYSILNKTIFNGLDINIEKGSFVSIIGENGVGKSTLLKLLSGEIITNNTIKIDNIQINKFNIDEVAKKVSSITYYNEFFSKTVMQEILQERKNISVFEINKVRKILDEFNLLYLEKMSVQKLSYAENQIIALIKAIVKKPKVIFLDNAFSKLDIDKRNELFDYLKKFASENDITIISTTNNVEDLRYSDRIILLKYSNIFFDGNYNELINNVDLYKEGLKLPWEVDFSNKLILYDLIDKSYDSIDEIVGELCK